MDQNFSIVDETFADRDLVQHFKQTANGLDIDNADFNVNVSRKHLFETSIVTNSVQVDKDGNIFSFGGSFYEGEIPAPSELRKRDLIDPVEALKGAVNTLQLPVEAEEATAEPTDVEDSYVLRGTSGAEKDPKAQLMYIQQDGQLKLTFRVETDILSNWLLSYVDANTKDVHAVVDWSADASYSV
jgi:extracellular elastinolytic metalloproteinase